MIGISIGIGSQRRGASGPPAAPTITSSDGDPASLTDNGDGTFDVVIDSVTVGTITQEQINAGGWITVVEPVAGMNVDGVTVELQSTGHVIYVGTVSIETDVEVLADGAVVGTALPFDAAAYPNVQLLVRWSFTVGFGADLVIESEARAQSADWTPAELGSAVWGWYDFSDDATVTTVDGAVSQITNKGTGGPTLSQAVAARRPALLPANLNGLDVADFLGGDDNLSSNAASWFTNGAMTMAAVYNPFALNSGGALHVIGNDGLGSATSRKYLVTNGVDFGNTQLNGTGITNDQWNIAVADVAGAGGTPTTQRHWSNGNTPVSGSVTNNANTTSLLLGANKDGTQGADVIIAEAIIIQGQLTDANRQRLEGYYAHKFGLTARLPSGHPYKTARPFA